MIFFREDPRAPAVCLDRHRGWEAYIRHDMWTSPLGSIDILRLVQRWVQALVNETTAF